MGAPGTYDEFAGDVEFVGFVPLQFGCLEWRPNNGMN